MQEIKKYDNILTIQLLLFIEESLSKYYKKVRGEVCNLSYLITLPFDFSQRCPLCTGKNCAVFLGYYTREVVDEKGTFYKYFPIARYKCQGKKSYRIVHHKTFSLLPYQLVPYCKYSIPFIIKTLRARNNKGLSIYELQKYLDTFCKDIISICAEHLAAFRDLINKAIEKIMISPHYQTLKEEVPYESTTQEDITIFLKFAKRFECHKTEPSIRGPCALGYDFYLSSGGYMQNAHFLFGTASQFRD